MVVSGGIGSVYCGSPLDDVEVEFENALLAQDEFGDGNECEFGALAENGAAGPEEEVFDELLRDGGGSAAARAFEIVLSSDLDLVPVESMVLVEPGIFRGDNGVLEFGRDLADGNEAVVLVIGHAVEQSLHAALHVNGGGGWIDEAEQDESKSCK